MVESLECFYHLIPFIEQDANIDDEVASSSIPAPIPEYALRIEMPAPEPMVTTMSMANRAAKWPISPWAGHLSTDRCIS